MKPSEKIAALRLKHVDAASQKHIQGRLNVVREQHVRVAKVEHEMRSGGVRLHVMQESNVYNACPYLKRSVPLTTCLMHAVNYTQKICFGCEIPDEIAAMKNLLQEHDVRTDPRQWTPYFLSTYVDGKLEARLREPFAHLRVELPNGDVFWLRRFKDGLTDLNLYSRLNEESSDVHWWAPRREDAAPPNSSLSAEELRLRLHNAEAARRRLSSGKADTKNEDDDETPKKTKKKGVK